MLLGPLVRGRPLTLDHRPILFNADVVVAFLALQAKVRVLRVLVVHLVIDYEKAALQVLKGMLQVAIRGAIINQLSCGNLVDENVRVAVLLWTVPVHLFLHHDILIIEKLDLFTCLLSPQRVIRRGVLQEAYLQIVKLLALWSPNEAYIFLDLYLVNWEGVVVYRELLKRRAVRVAV